MKIKIVHTAEYNVDSMADADRLGDETAKLAGSFAGERGAVKVTTVIKRTHARRTKAEIAAANPAN